MNWFEGFNKVIAYIEEHLEEEINYEAMADILGYSVYHFQRLFLLVSNASAAEYIRCRRLSKAAVDLSSGDDRVLDIAVKYGYSSPGAFNRAFKAFHGIAPGDVRKSGTVVKAYPPLSFEIKIKGAQVMNYRIVQMDAFRIVGKRLKTTMENGECYQKVPGFWGELAQSGGPGDILALMDGEPMGLLGISDYDPSAESSAFDYYIAVSSSKPVPQGMAALVVPARTWAIFSCKETEPDQMQQFQQQIVLDWLPSSGYEFDKAPDIEIYNDSGMIETWLPITKSCV